MCPSGERLANDDKSLPVELVFDEAEPRRMSPSGMWRSVGLVLTDVVNLISSYSAGYFPLVTQSAATCQR
jgi:hypothetical protein